MVGFFLIVLLVGILRMKAEALIMTPAALFPAAPLAGITQQTVAERSACLAGR